MLDIEDHRRLGERLDLFHFQDEAPGMVFWHPRGFILFQLLEAAARAELHAQAYAEVRTPQILRKAIWDASGHWEHFSAGMFRIEDQSVAAAVKPVSCPGHIEILRRRAPSYRDLPIRLAEFGVVHRDEPGGTLHGLLRLRQCTQDDGHVFCAPESAEDEVARFCGALRPFYAAFGFDEIEVGLALRPDDRAGDDASWDAAEIALERALVRMGWAFHRKPGEGAFYGPKIEIALGDRAGRSWQCGTVQLDLVMPQRFGLVYVDRSGERKHPVMIHRALYGSIERFLGVLLEHHGAALPAWLSPEQVAVFPVGAAHEGAAEALVRRLGGVGVRSAVIGAATSLSRRIAEAHERGVPYMAVIGDREARGGTVTLRERGGQSAMSADDAIARIARECAAPFAA